MDNVQLNLEFSLRKDLDIKCPRKIRVRIADEIIDEWYSVGVELDVSNKKLISIRSDNSLTPEEKAVAVLDAWAEEHGSRATCLRLAEALHRRIKTRVIEILCGEVTQIKRDATTFVGAGAATALQPSDNQQQEQGHHIIIEHDDEVVTRMEELDSQFRLLHEKMESELELKKVTVRKLLRSLSVLPYDIEQEYKQTITEKLPDLHKEEVSDIFCLYINPLVSFMDYGLTKHIIDQYGSNTLKKEMNDYSEDVVQFMKKATVKEMMDHWPGPQKIPPNYSVLMVTINENPKLYTLYDVDKLRKLYCSELKMSTLTFKTIRLRMSNSFIIEWLVPSALVPHLVESAKQVNFGFYFHERILKVVVGEKQIFSFLPDSKPKVPALQTTAAMVTKWNRADCFWLLGIILVFLIITTFAILQIAQFVMLVELIKDGSNTDSNSTSIRTKLDYMLNVLGRSAYCLEYITLIYGLCKFSCYYCKLNDTDKHGTGTDGNGNNPTTIIDKNQVKKNNCYNNNCGIFVLVVVISLIAWLLHFSLSFIPPILLVIWREDIVLGYKSSIRKANTYASLAFFNHYYNFLTRTGMVFVTVLVVHTWMKAAKNIKVEEKDGKMIKNLVKNYTESGEYVNALQTIFQGWFVIKWIIYLNDIIGHSVLAAETIFKSEIKHKLGYYVLAHLVYDFLAFFFLFFCGSLMNLYHSKYRQRQKLLLNASDVTPVVILESSSTLIPVNPEYDFLPSVCMIDFPLNSPGYIVTMFLALFAFVANYITQFE